MLKNTNEEGEGPVGEDSGVEDNDEVQVLDDESAHDKEHVESDDVEEANKDVEMESLPLPTLEDHIQMWLNLWGA